MSARNIPCSSLPPRYIQLTTDPLPRDGDPDHRASDTFTSLPPHIGDLNNEADGSATAEQPMSKSDGSATAEQPTSKSAVSAAASIIDPEALPNILDLIISYSDESTLLAMLTVKSIRKPVLAEFYRHLEVTLPGIQSPHYHVLPPHKGTEYCKQQCRKQYIAAFCRTLDLKDYWQFALALEYASYASHYNLHTFRCTGGDLKAAKKLPPTIIFRFRCVPLPNFLGMWNGAYILQAQGLAEGPKTLVFNIAYSWPHRLFCSILLMDELPLSVNEIVIHLKKYPQDRPRFLLYKHLWGDIYHPIKALTLQDRPPMPSIDENIHYLSYGELTGVGSLFEQLAAKFADAIGRGTPQVGRPNRHLKLTLVGVDEFDSARDRDSAEDDEAHPWATAYYTPILGPDASAFVDGYHYAQPPYTSIADRFVDDVAKLVHKEKRGFVHRNVKVMSSAEYYAKLSSQRRKAEDWW